MPYDSFNWYPHIFTPRKQNTAFLSLRKNNLDEKSLIDIAQLMTLNRTLKCLDLSCNNFGAKNLVLATNALHKIITASPCLQELSISNSNLNCDGIICIFEAAVATTGLRRLDVSLNPIERRGVVAALDGVRGCKGLISVEVVPILDTAGNCIEIKEQCAVNRDVLMAKREKRPVLESTDSFLESQFSLISAPAEKKLSDLDPTPLSASEELISESIVHNSSMVESPTTVNSTFKESSKAESSLCEGPKFSLIKFQHEILEAEEICIVLEEMLDQVQKCVTHQTGESSEAVPIDGDIMQEFYSKTKTFRPRLSYLIRSNTIQDEETLCASLGLHDRIEKVLAAYDHVVNALSSQKVMEPLSTTSLQRKGSSSKEMESLKSKHSESESQQRGIGSNFKNSTMAWFDKARDALTLRKASPSEKRQTPSSNLSAEEQSTLLLALSPSKVQVLPTQTPITQISSVYTTFSEPFAVPHFMSSEYQKSPATLSVDDSHDTLLHSYSPTDSLQRPPRMESSTSDSSDFNPAVPPTQLLFPKKTKALEERGSRSNTLCVANETPRARGFSVTSFDDVMDGTTEDSARKYMDDGFLAELDSQMKEIDEFLSSTHIPPMNQ
ncbi:hypothetical protein BCR33DRAFT_740591 [Rhizoclosmatium globosum]|uniref:GAT domain-containing protein n=1 Tax=Rhizoclosmatium globosum TaxID=329046 RepID=A0A1Y2C0R7_9FUNG|nr:hypothetical protein BCR33DRAFT_740591 [Rhizoclosmatium globosum]|eukprot:ORY39905.1 hypothetical protein BCR33DRAFT_740591 [Rhizoclosmatium globosum]